MSTWIFEPGHTEAEFKARHMTVTSVRALGPASLPKTTFGHS